MKYKIRITREPHPSVQDREQYKHLYFQVLVDNSYNKSGYLEPAVTLSWQGDKERDYWYGFDVRCTSDKPQHFELAAKTIKLIYDKCETKSPAEVLAGLQAEVYAYDNGNYVPVSLIGSNKYQIFKDGQGFKQMYAFGGNAVQKEIYRLIDQGYKATEWKYELLQEKVQLYLTSIEP